MDKAKDVGAGWRAQVEYEFEVKNGGKKSEMNDIVIPYYGDDITVKPAYTVDNENMNRFIEEGGNKSSSMINAAINSKEKVAMRFLPGSRFAHQNGQL